jgi:glycerol-1-phosphate dehydrogenase [NAD(P)+]
MTAAGYADLASKLTAGADWIIADALGIDEIDPRVWDMVQTDLRRWIGEPEKLRAGDAQAFGNLFEGLTMAGLGLQALRRSRAASGSEHLLNNVWEAEGGTEVDGKPVSHGFMVAIGTLAGTALMETVFSMDIATLDIDAVCRDWPSWEEREARVTEAFGGTPAFERVHGESQAKYLDVGQLHERLDLIGAHWGDMREKVAARLVPFGELRQMFVDAGCPVEPEQVGLTREHLRETFFLAQMLRNRYTILDLAFEMGRLEAAVDRIFAPDGYFPLRAFEE